MSNIDWKFLFRSEGLGKEKCHLCGNTFKAQGVLVAIGARCRDEEGDERVLGDEHTPICSECFGLSTKAVAARACENAVRFQQKARQTRDYMDRDHLESVSAQLGIMACSLETMKDFSGIHGYPMAARIQEYYRTQAAGKAA